MWLTSNRIEIFEEVCIKSVVTKLTSLYLCHSLSVAHPLSQLPPFCLPPSSSLFHKCSDNCQANYIILNTGTNDVIMFMGKTLQLHKFYSKFSCPVFHK